MEHTSNLTHMNEQQDCRLMQLPQELRDQIYQSLLPTLPTTLSFERYTNKWSGTSRESFPHDIFALIHSYVALLCTCRRIRKELGDQWLANVTLEFFDQETMLMALHRFTPMELRFIRHMRTSTREWVLFDEEFSVTRALLLVPGLSLDTLTIDATEEQAQPDYEIADQLICDSSGWKTLQFFTRNSKVLAEISLDPSRLPQPEEWQMAMDERDGRATRPSVTIYRSNDANAPNAVFDPSRRSTYQQHLAYRQTADDFGAVEDAFLSRPDEIGKSVLVVVERGVDVNYAVQDGMNVGLLANHTWPEIKAELEKDMAEEEELDRHLALF